MRYLILVATAIVLVGGMAVGAFVYPESVASLANTSFFGCGDPGCCPVCDACPACPFTSEACSAESSACPLSASENASAAPSCCSKAATVAKQTDE